VHEYTNTSTKTYFYAIILVSDSAGQAYLYNTHGDVIRLIGTLTWNYTYDAYGVQKNPDPLDGNAFRYAGQYFDTESGTYYLRARYYNPNTGRFTQQDAWANANRGDPLGLNLYCYCNGNPVRYFDPWGQKPGDRFETVDAAAIDFATEYNGLSIEEDVEYGSAIYQVIKYEPEWGIKYYQIGFLKIPYWGEKENVIDSYYTYSEPITGSEDSVRVSRVPGAYYEEEDADKGKKIKYKHIEKAQIHTHGAYKWDIISGYDAQENEVHATSQNGFSDSDLRIARRWKNRKVNTYVVTQWGYLYKATYLDNYEKQHRVATGFASDPVTWEYQDYYEFYP